VIVLFDKKSTSQFSRSNFFFRLREKLIISFNKPLDLEFSRKWLRNDYYDFNGIYLPKINNTTLMRGVYQDVLRVYTEMGDNYSYQIVDKLDRVLPEGVYCYVGPNRERIVINPGDVVFDIGAWIGDFSAYASKKGANVFAFEPSPTNIKLLNKTIELNKGNGGKITVVPFGLGDKKEVMNFVENDDDCNTGGNSFSADQAESGVKLNITTIDNWVIENNITKIDFIKADIEGFERKMLAGATKVLREFKPILSICTYHLPDDPQVLESIILKANPNYEIIQRRKKLFAFVPK
jgi:FkbM family methyltransferase